MILTALEKLDRMTVTTVSPDGGIRLRLRNERDIDCAFRSEDVFREYDAENLAHQIGESLCDLERRRRAGVRRILADAGRGFADETGPHWDAQRRRYREALAAMRAEGQSGRGSILVTVDGAWTDFTVEIDPRLSRKLDMKGFAAELGSAYRLLRFTHNQKRRSLKDRYLPR